MYIYMGKVTGVCSNTVVNCLGIVVIDIELFSGICTSCAHLTKLLNNQKMEGLKHL